MNGLTKKIGSLFLHLWLALEHFVFKHLMTSFVKDSVIKAYQLDSRNKDALCIKSDETYTLVATKGLLGLAIAQAKGYAEVRDMESLITNLMSDKNLFYNPAFKYKAFLEYLEYDYFHIPMNSEDHYGLGNHLFESMLDSKLNYSCAVWKTGDSLESAQRRKMETLAKRLKLKKGMRVLELGCGWGGMASFLAEKYCVHVTAITNSAPGARYAKDLCKGLDVDVVLGDAREVLKRGKTFDRVVAIEILEHVGSRNYKEFFQSIASCLHEDGLFVLQTFVITNPDMPTVDSLSSIIMPGSSAPRMGDVIGHSSKANLVIERLDNIGPSYYETAKAFVSGMKNNRSLWLAAKGEEWVTALEFYYQVNGVMAKLRIFQVFHIVFSKNGINDNS